MDEPEVIQESMEHTRQSLADKLESLERKVVGTVESVTDSVQKTVDSVTGTVGTVTDNVQEAVDNVTEGVKSAFDIPGHVRNYPWAMFGGSVVVGFLAGRLMHGMFPRTSGERLEAASFGPDTYGTVPTDFSRGTTAPRIMSGNGHGAGAAGPGYAAPEAEQQRPQQQGWFSKLLDQFGPQIDQLKGLALGTTIGVARDLIVKSLPDSLKQDVTGFMNDLTKNVGGKPIDGPVVQEDQGQPASQQESGYRGSAGWSGRR